MNSPQKHRKKHQKYQHRLLYIIPFAPLKNLSCHDILHSGVLFAKHLHYLYVIYALRKKKLTL